MKKWDIEYEFRNGGYDLKQIQKIGELLRILGRYMFVDWDVLQARASDKINLKYIKNVSYSSIVVELKNKEVGEKEDNKYYYQLGVGGLYLLNLAKESYNEINILADHEARSRILTFNHFALEKDYNLLIHKQDNYHRYFFCKDNIVCFFTDAIKEIDIIRIILSYMSNGGQKDITVDKVRDMYRFIPITKKLIKIGSKTRNEYYTEHLDD